MCEAIEESITDVVAPEMRVLLHASVQGNITTILRLLRHDAPLAGVEPIPQAAEYAIALAQRGDPSASLRRAHHFGSDDLLAQVFQEVRQIDIDADTRLRLLHHLAGWVHTYVDWITRQVLEADEDERRQIADRSASLAAPLVRGVLTSDQPPEGFTERTGYRLDQHHLAAVLWVAGGNPGVDLTDALRDVAHELAAAVNTSRVLVTAVDRSTCWVWLGQGPDVEPVNSAQLRPVLAPHRGMSLAPGRTARGAEGFRCSHAEAEATRRVLSVSQTGAQIPALPTVRWDRCRCCSRIPTPWAPGCARCSGGWPRRTSPRTACARRFASSSRTTATTRRRRTSSCCTATPSPTAWQGPWGTAVLRRGGRLDLALALEAVRLLGPAALR
ncbi:MAG: hypothetical protein H7233_10400 [Pseudorhodobacter sp.]|nr:hypothetical protein [Frankiaceae bacterium]